jgi:uncharacterized protein (DUF1015 family)
MLDDAKIGALYAKHPANAVRIDQNKREPGDATNRDRHVRAAAFFADWVKQGLIVCDDTPSLYIYEQKFTIVQAGRRQSFTRTGVVSLVKLVDFADGVVLPHEYTLSGPKIDRYEHLDATRLNVGQIFGLLSDDTGSVFSLIQKMKSTVIGTALDDTQVEHVLYRCSDASLIAEYQAAAKPGTILIADGHHRYETALNFYREHGNDPAHAYTMMTLVSMADPGLVIRSFHRLIRRQPGELDMKKSLEANYTLTDLGLASQGVIDSFLGMGISAEMLFADAASRRIYGLSLNASGEKFLQTTIPERSLLWKHLDVSQINAIVVNRILGLPLDGTVLHDVIEYMNDTAQALDMCMDASEFYGGFFIRPAAIGTVHKIVAAGERMPQKSTNFYPKLFSGLVINKLGDA